MGVPYMGHPSMGYRYMGVPYMGHPCVGIPYMGYPCIGNPYMSLYEGEVGVVCICEVISSVYSGMKVEPTLVLTGGV